MQSILLEPRFSYGLMSFILVTHIAAFALLSVLALPLFFFMGIFLFCLASLGYTFYRHRLGFPSYAIKKAYWAKQQGWHLLNRKNELMPAELLSNTYVSSYLILLNFKLKTQEKISLVLFADALDTDIFRQLRVLLLTRPL